MAKTPTKIRKRSLTDIFWDRPEVSKTEQLLDDKIDYVEDRLIRSYRITKEHVLEDIKKLYDEIDKEGADNVLHSHLYQYQKDYETLQNIEKELRSMYQTDKTVLTKEFTDTYKQSRSIVQRSYGFSPVLDSKEVRAGLEEFWLGDGNRWSDRLWADKSALLTKMEEEVVDILTAGKTYAQASKDIADAFGVSYSNANRLVRTEMAHINNKAKLDSYKTMGVDQYRYLTANDDRTCPVCSALDNQIFNIADKSYGDNCPPMHPNCRCTIVAVMDYDKMITEGDHTSAYESYAKSLVAQNRELAKQIINIKSEDKDIIAFQKIFYQAKDKSYKDYLWNSYYVEKTGRRPDWKESQVYGSRAWKLEVALDELENEAYKLTNIRDDKKEALRQLLRGDYTEKQYEARIKYIEEESKKLEERVAKIRAEEKAKAHEKYLKYKEKLKDDPKLTQWQKEVEDGLHSDIRVCEECGKPYWVSTKDNSSTKCPACQAKWRRKYEAERKRNKRKAEKLLKNKDKK